MKKILYYTPKDITDLSAGINKKIVCQIIELRKHFYVEAIYRKNDCQLVLQKNDGTERIIASRMRRPYKIEASRALSCFLRKKSYDGFYIRYVFADRQFIRALNEMKKMHATVVLEIPSYPYIAELSNSFENRIVLLLDKIYRKSMKPYVDRIATYSKDKMIYAIPTLQVVNGVNFNQILVAQHKNNLTEINMIAVANLAVGHGYDRLLVGMGEYYASGGQRDMHFYQVGIGKQVEMYRKIVKEYHIQDRVTFCGNKNGKELDDLYDKCTLAIEVLAPHRQGIKQSSSLKSREYAAKGLPMLTATDIDIFKKENLPYILKIDANESPVNIEKLISFHDTLYSEKNINLIAQEIRAYAQKLCDMDVVMRPIVELLEGHSSRI